MLVGRRGTSIYDIAKIAGVSAATVSNVLNDKGRVSERTRRLVMDIAHEQGYVANFAAKSLRESQTKTVGVVTPDVSNDFFSSIVRSIETRMNARGYLTYICDTDNRRDQERRCVENLVQRQVDGLIYVGGNLGLDLQGVPESMPCVAIDRVCGEAARGRCVRVGNNMRQVNYDATSLLVRKGCAHVAFLCVTANDERVREDERYLGFCDALHDGGLRLDKNLVLVGQPGAHGMDEASRLLGECLDDDYVPDGIVAVGDRVALGAMRELQRRGMGVGDDVLLIGQDNSLYSRIASPAISSVERHTDQMAQRGVAALLCLMDGDEPQSREQVIPHELVERATTDR